MSRPPPPRTTPSRTCSNCTWRGKKGRARRARSGHLRGARADSVNDPPQPGKPGAHSFLVPRPVNKEGFALDEVSVQRPAEAAVVGVVRVIPHHELVPLRHHVGTIVVPIS